MNKNRRKRLGKVVASLEGLSNKVERSNIGTTLDQSQKEVELIADEEQEVLDNMPENLQSSQRYEDIENNVDDLQDASAELEIAVDEFQAPTSVYNDIEVNVTSAIKSINKAIVR